MTDIIKILLLRTVCWVKGHDWEGDWIFDYPCRCRRCDKYEDAT